MKDRCGSNIKMMKEGICILFDDLLWFVSDIIILRFTH